jgi:hypothetical protein
MIFCFLASSRAARGFECGRQFLSARLACPRALLLGCPFAAEFAPTAKDSDGLGIRPGGRHCGNFLRIPMPAYSPTSFVSPGGLTCRTMNFLLKGPLSAFWLPNGFARLMLNKRC